MFKIFKYFPYQYHLRNMFARKASTSLNLFAIFVTVLVFLVMNGMAEGLHRSLQDTGRDLVLVILSKGAESAEASRIPKDHFPIIRYYPEIAKRTDGTAKISEESYTVKPLKPIGGGDKRWIPIRAIDPESLDVYQDVLKIRGSALQKSQEIIVGSLVRLKMGQLQIGDSIEIGRSRFKVAGFFTAKGSAFESEIWMTRRDFKVAFNVNYDSLAVIDFKEKKSRDAFIDRIANDQRLRVDVKTEREYFSSLDRSASVLEMIATIIAIILSIAAVFTGMNALYASIASRTKEIGTMRSMGFGRQSILLGLIFEGLSVALLAGILATLLSLPFQHLPIAYMRSSFRIIITFPLILKGWLVCFAVGLIGSWVPARRASRLKIVEALRS